MFGRILTLLKDGDLRRIPRYLRLNATAISAAVTHIRQCEEWGMGAIDKAFALRNRLYSVSLPLSCDSAWTVMYRTACDASMINVMGFNLSTLNLILREFASFCEVKSVSNCRGRPSHYYNSTMLQKSLCQIFGCPPSTVSRVLQNAEAALEQAVKTIPGCAIRWPSHAQQHEWAALVHAKEPLLLYTWVFIDGLKYPIQNPYGYEEKDVQSAFFNGKNMRPMCRFDV